MSFSKIISILLHPIFLPTLMLYLSLKLIPNIGLAITNYLPFIYLIIMLSSIILPLLSTFFLIRSNLVSSLEISNNKERPLPLLVTALWMIYGYYKLNDILVFSPILRSEFLGAVVIIIVAAAISKYWKISLHMLGVGGAVGVLFGLNILFGGLLKIIGVFILLSGVLGAARLSQKAHNHSQLYIGFLIGFLIESGFVLFF